MECSFIYQSWIQAIKVKETFASKLDGYGKTKHPSKYMIKYDMKWYRVYSHCISNVASYYILRKNRVLWIPDSKLSELKATL